MRYHFEDAEVDTDAFELRVAGERVPVEPQDFDVRLVGDSDVEFLWEMLYYAAHVDEDDGVGLADMRRDTDLAGHVVDWGRSGDIGVIAERRGTLIGAAWLRLFVQGVSDYSVFVDDETPELVIAVAPEETGRGIGASLLTELFQRADRLHAASVLSVRSNNEALRLYQRFSYREIDRIANRVGTESIKMIRRLGQ